MLREGPATPSSLIDILLARQNSDGGWPYTKGVSWTEPTVYGALAMLAAGQAESARRGISWLRTVDRTDGGWAPQKSVEESTWVTALVALLPPDQVGEARHRRGIEWLMRLTGRESTRMYRLRQWMLGVTPPAEQSHHGWPWFPGAAAWVGPTCVAILALRKELGRHSSAEVAERVEQGRQFLLARSCRGGGWNHGSARALGYDGLPYPETTGMALTALAGAARDKVSQSIAAAERFLAVERSSDGRTWLRLGLLAHRRPIPIGLPAPSPCRTVRDVALTLLAEQAIAGRNGLWAS
jgi:hypothetical protein